MKLAVLGLGSIGMRHAKNALAMGITVVGYDPELSRRKAFKNIGGIAANSRNEALQGAQAAVIASPNAYHLEDIRAVLEEQCHIMVEKPIAHSIEGLEGLLSKAKKQNLLIYAAHNLRVHPAVKAAKKILEQKQLGKILWARSIAASYLPNWRPKQDYRKGFAVDSETGGAVFDFIHEFDLLAHLLGRFTVKSVLARHTGILEMEAEDIVDAILYHEGNIVSVLHIDYLTRPPIRTTEIAGSEGRLTIDILNRSLVHATIDGATVIDKHFGGKHDDDYIEEMHLFMAAIKNESNLPCDGEEALIVLEEIIKLRELANLPAKK